MSKEKSIPERNRDCKQGNPSQEKQIVHLINCKGDLNTKSQSFRHIESLAFTRRAQKGHWFTNQLRFFSAHEIEFAERKRKATWLVTGTSNIVLNRGFPMPTSLLHLLAAQHITTGCNSIFPSYACTAGQSCRHQERLPSEVIGNSTFTDIIRFRFSNLKYSVEIIRW